MKNLNNDEEKRDYLIGYYNSQAREHFGELLSINQSTAKENDLFIDILSELIANSIMHSGTDVYAMMFVDKYSTRFSIADNGIGLKESLEKKDESIESHYKKQELSILLKTVRSPVVLPEVIKENLIIIFETLYFSMIKKRVGLFDLMANVVLEGKGRFRLHTDRAQIIISRRMGRNLVELHDIRRKIREAYYSNNESIIPNLAESAKNIFILFYKNTLIKYDEDVNYSSVRFYSVKFKGVHVEIEIPKI